VASVARREQDPHKGGLSRLASHGYRWLRAAWTLLQGLPQHASQNGPDLPGLSRRVWEQGRLLLVSGITPTNYYRYRLFRPTLSSDNKALFLGFFEGWRWLLAVNGRKPSLLVTDKLITSRMLQSCGIAQPEHLGTFGLPLGRFDRAAPLRTREELAQFLAAPGRADFFLKPAYGRGGAGHFSVGRCLREGKAWELLPDRSMVTTDALIDRVVAAGTPYIAQRRLRPHQELACFGANVLHTIRFITVLDGDVTIAQAALKIGTGAGPVDNMAMGNIIAGIDMETGVLGAAYEHYSAGRLLLCRPVTTHPLTNSGIEGRQIPLWREALETVHKAAACFYLMSVAAWDVALTDQGPVVIEGNSDPNWLLTQVANDEGLLATPLGAFLYRTGHLDKIGVGIGLKAAYERAVLARG